MHSSPAFGKRHSWYNLNIDIKDTSLATMCQCGNDWLPPVKYQSFLMILARSKTFPVFWTVELIKSYVTDDIDTSDANTLSTIFKIYLVSRNNKRFVGKILRAWILFSFCSLLRPLKKFTEYDNSSCFRQSQSMLIYISTCKVKKPLSLAVWKKNS